MRKAAGRVTFEVRDERDGAWFDVRPESPPASGSLPGLGLWAGWSAVVAALLVGLSALTPRRAPPPPEGP